MPEKLKPSYKFNETQLEQLKQIVPEAFKDGMLDFNSLYDALKDHNEEDSEENPSDFPQTLTTTSTASTGPESGRQNEPPLSRPGEPLSR